MEVLVTSWAMDQDMVGLRQELAERAVPFGLSGKEQLRREGRCGRAGAVEARGGDTGAERQGDKEDGRSHRA